MKSFLADLTIRPAEITDIESVYTVIFKQNGVDFGEPLLSLDDLQARWQSSDFSFTEHSCVALSEKGQFLGYAEIRPYSPTKFSSQLYLAPNQPFPKLGKHLLTVLEANLNKKAQLIAKVSGQNVQNQLAFEAAGYSRGLTFLMMEIVMEKAPPIAKWPDAIVVRPFIPNQDEQATYQTDEAASADKGYSNPLSFTAWSKRMSLNNPESFDPTLWFLACINEEIIGLSLNFYLEERNYGLIDHLGVQRSWRGQGIGLALLQHSFAAFYARGIKKVRLNVDSGSLTNAPRLDEKAGMTTVQSYHIYTKETV